VSTITHLFINDVPVVLTGAAAFAGSTPESIVTDIAATGLSLDAGESADVQIWIDLGYATLSSGTTVNVKLHSAGGMDYIKLIRLT